MNKISLKLILAVSFVTVLIIGIFSFVIIKGQQRALISQVEHNAHQLSETVKSSTKYDMLINQRESLHHIIDTIGQQDGIHKIRIFNKEGEIIYSSDKSEIAGFVDKKAEACYGCHVADQPLERLSIPERTRIFDNKEHSTQDLGIINPIYNERRCWDSSCHAHDADQKVLGVLDITMCLEEAEAQLNANQNKMSLLAVSSIVAISLILWLFVQKLVGKPVGRIVKATNIVASGDFDYRVEDSGNDELGQLGKSFNAMTQKLKEVQHQLYQSDKLASLGRLAAGVAHEINNPLTGVLTYSSFLLKRTTQDEKTKQDLQVIVDETKRCREIVKGLLDFARQAPPQKTVVNLNEVITDTIEILSNQLSISKITLNRRLTENLPELRVDANQVRQILINLIENAADAIDGRAREISIATNLVRKDKKRFVEVKVSDTGCGIPKSNLSKIFDPFYTTKGQKGTGLGLAVVWGIVDSHGGTITVDSEVDKGSTFTIRLPADDNTVPLIEG